MLNRPVCVPLPRSRISPPADALNVPSLSNTPENRSSPEPAFLSIVPLFVKSTPTVRAKSLVAVIELLLTILPVPLIVLPAVKSVQVPAPPIVNALSSDNVSPLALILNPPRALKAPVPVIEKLVTPPGSFQNVSPVTVISPAPPIVPSVKNKLPLMVVPEALVSNAEALEISKSGVTTVDESRLTLPPVIVTNPVPLQLLGAWKS